MLRQSGNAIFFLFKISIILSKNIAYLSFATFIMICKCIFANQCRAFKDFLKIFLYVFLITVKTIFYICFFY